MISEELNKKLPRKSLENLIKEFLIDECMCVIATSSEDIPRASSVEFFPIGTTIYIMTEGGKKMDNIRKNPRVSIAVHAQFTGWENVRGVQIDGIAEIGRKGSRIFEEGAQAYQKRRRLDSKDLPDFINVIKVTPQVMEYIDTTLGDKGFANRQKLVLKI